MKRINASVHARWLLLSMLSVIGAAAASDDQTLVEAVKQQDTAAVRQLIKQNVDVNELQSDGATALHWAAYRDDLELSRLLIEAGANVTIEHLVVFGHHLSEYKRLIDEHAVDLLVLNTKDEDQLAMHGIAYALAVELREIPLLML